MNFEDLPLRHPRDIFVQDSCRAIRRTLLGMKIAQSKDFWMAFIAEDTERTSEQKSIRKVFDTMADSRWLTPGERMLIIGILLQDRSNQIIKEEMLRGPR